MAFSVNTNVGALAALQNLAQTSRALQVVQNRINTGLKVAGAKDNSAVFAIAQNLRGDIGGLNAVKQSLNNATSTLDIGINAAESVSNLIVQAREVAIAASDTGLDASTRTALNNDFQALVTQIDSIVGQAEFNGVNLLKATPDSINAISGVKGDGTVTSLSVAGVDITSAGAAATLASVTVGGTVTIDNSTFAAVTDITSFRAVFTQNLRDAITAEGLDANSVIDANNTNTLDFDPSEATFVDNGTTDTVSFKIGGATITVAGDFGTNAATAFEALAGGTAATVSVTGSQAVVNGDGTGTTLTNVTLQSLDLTNDQQRDASIRVVDNFLQNVNTVLANFGSSGRQIDLQIDFTSKLSDTIEAGIGNLVDADLARESARLQALQVKQQLGLQALSIANQAPSSILSLFR